MREKEEIKEEEEEKKPKWPKKSRHRGAKRC